MQKMIVVANWKMNPATRAEAERLFERTKKAAGNARSVRVIVAPPTIYLAHLARSYRGKQIGFAAQNIHWEHAGSFTGELSAKQAVDAGAAYTLIGHTERRALGETDEQVGKKVVAALALNLTPIVCVGERERDQHGEYLKVIRAQLVAALSHVPSGKQKQVCVAYEPVWAVGKDKTIDAHTMHEMNIFIHKVLSEIMGPHGLSVPVLYGGSIDTREELELLRNSEVAGFLIGRASTDTFKIRDLILALNEYRA